MHKYGSIFPEGTRALRSLPVHLVGMRPRRSQDSASAEYREKWRENAATKYKSLEKSSVFCDIIVQVLLDLQFIR